MVHNLSNYKPVHSENTVEIIPEWIAKRLLQTKQCLEPTGPVEVWMNDRLSYIIVRQLQRLHLKAQIQTVDTRHW